jgi:hypothetical protein
MNKLSTASASTCTPGTESIFTVNRPAFRPCWRIRGCEGLGETGQAGGPATEVGCAR